MKPGQEFQLDRLMLVEHFPTTLQGRPPIDGLLEALPGSNWGTYTVDWKLDGRAVIVRRHEAGKRRVREDWDRR